MSMLDSPTVALPIVTPKPPKRSSRKRTVAILVALLVGLPAVALAATYLFGLITGTAAVNDSTAAIQVTNVQGSDLAGGGAPGVTDVGGVNCSGSIWGHQPAGSQQTVQINTAAYRVAVNGQVPDPLQSLGTCAVVITVHNGGVAPASVSAVLDPLTGWTFAPTSAPPTVAPNSDATITIRITAKGTAVAAPITGKLNVDIPPLGAS